MQKATLSIALLAVGALGSCNVKEPERTPPEQGTSPPTAEQAPQDTPPVEKPGEKQWAEGDTIASGQNEVPDIRILTVHANGSGPACGKGKSATLRYKAMQANGKVLDPGDDPYTFTVGQPGSIEGWSVVVAEMRIGDSLTLIIPEALAYPGRGLGDLKFDMELLSFE